MTAQPPGTERPAALGRRRKAGIVALVFAGSAAAALVFAWIQQPRPTVVDPMRAQAFDKLQASLPSPRPATANECRSTVVIATCTATKVGPAHYLTAAHCLVDPATGTVRPWLRPSFPLTLSNRLDTRTSSDGDVEAQVVIRSVHIHPDYRSDLDAAYREEDYRPDIAVVVVDRDITGIPTTPVGGWHIGDDAELVLVGTRPPGAEPADAAPSDRRVKWIPTRSVGFDPGYEFDPAKLGRALLLTAGPAARYEACAIGFGDSGGPVLQTIGDRSFVVGVHAVTFDKTVGHARLDDESGFGVASWLRDLGVQIVTLPPKQLSAP